MSDLIVKNANDELKQAIRALLEGHKSVQVVEEDDVIDPDDFKITKTLQKEISKFWMKEVKLNSTIFGGAPVELLLLMNDDWYEGSSEEMFYVRDLTFTNCEVSRRECAEVSLLDTWSGDTVLELAKANKAFAKEYDKLVKAATEEYNQLQRKVTDALRKQYPSVKDSQVAELVGLFI